jgi:hypothetical protein
MKINKVTQAYDRCAAVREALSDNGKCVEITEDKAGILWERYVLHNGRSAILFATPSWYDVFVPATDSVNVGDTIAAIVRASHGGAKAE